MSALLSATGQSSLYPSWNSQANASNVMGQSASLGAASMVAPSAAPLGDLFQGSPELTGQSATQASPNFASSFGSGSSASSQQAQQQQQALQQIQQQGVQDNQQTAQKNLQIQQQEAQQQEQVAQQLNQQQTQSADQDQSQSASTVSS